MSNETKLINKLLEMMLKALENNDIYNVDELSKIYQRVATIYVAQQTNHSNHLNQEGE